jgi:hypothetical protein
MLGANVRQAVHAGIDLHTGLLGSKWAREARKAITILCLIGKIASACHTFAEVTTKIWLGYSFKITALQIPSPARVTKNIINIATAIRRIGVPSNHPAMRDCNKNNTRMFTQKFSCCSTLPRTEYRTCSLMSELANCRAFFALPC